MKKIFRLTLILCLFLGLLSVCVYFALRYSFSTSSVLAEDKQSEALKLNEALEKAKTQEDCHSAFLQLWNMSKKGNMEARVVILGRMVSMYPPYLLFPSPVRDHYSQSRYRVLWDMYSMVPKKTPQTITLDFFLYEISDTGPDSTFGQCLIKENRSQKCLKILTDKHIIPTFEEFASEIDSFINSGFKAWCTTNYEPEKTSIDNVGITKRQEQL